MNADNDVESVGDNPSQFVPRSYQVKLMNVAKSENSIVYLPTGAGKTYIALMVLKQMMGPLQKPYAEGGKLGMMLVNTVPLVDQHSKYLSVHTPLKVHSLSGDMNVDCYSETKWNELFSQFNMFVLTAKILENALKMNYLDINRIHIIILDECHHAVEAHTMREILKEFEHATEEPRVLGLTATLLNKNVNSDNAATTEIRRLEISLHSKVIGVDAIDEALLYSANPTEKHHFFAMHKPTLVEIDIVDKLQKLVELLRQKHSEEKTYAKQKSTRTNLIMLNLPSSYKKLARLVEDTIYQIETLGIFGGWVALQAHIVQLTQIRLSAVDYDFTRIVESIVTTLVLIRNRARAHIDACLGQGGPDKKRVLLQKLLSPKLELMLLLLHEYGERDRSFDLLDEVEVETGTEELPFCALLFVQRRFTAQILYHVINEYVKLVPELKHVRCNYMTGYNTNPYNNTRTALYDSKVNRKIVRDFWARKINLLVCTEVMEEGVDIPMCSLVIKFDEPLNYRSYVQSRGRARHRLGKYVVMAPAEDVGRFKNKIKSYKSVQTSIADYLQNNLRRGPQQEEIEQTYNELELPTYYVDGPGSAHVTMNSAVALLHMYCMSLPGDVFTQHEPIFHADHLDEGKVLVVIDLPSVCIVKDAIFGPAMANVTKAKQAAALQTCKQLHQAGELDNNLKPKSHTQIDANTDYLFSAHWPSVPEQRAGINKMRRSYRRHVPVCVRSRIATAVPLYLHVIKLTPKFDTRGEQALQAFADMYSNGLCFGFVTALALPETMCKFPVYDSHGEIEVEITTNAQNDIYFDDTHLEAVRKFHFLVFNDVLTVVQDYVLMLGTHVNLLMVPVDRKTGHIRWDIVNRENNEIKPMHTEPTLDEKQKLVVKEEDYLNTIVSKWYRGDYLTYLVVRVLSDETPSSTFASGGDLRTYEMYFAEKYSITIVNKKQHLISVKGISKRLNCMKPRGQVKRRHDESVFEETLVPEMLVKQDFPGSLWVQSRTIPTVMHRMLQLLRAQELHTRLRQETDLGALDNDTILPLEADVHLITDREQNERAPISSNDMMDCVPSAYAVNDNSNEIRAICDATEAKPESCTIYEELNRKKSNENYPWQESDEPVDIRRVLEPLMLDIETFTRFTELPVSQLDREQTRVSMSAASPRRNCPAIGYNKPYEYRGIGILKKRRDTRGSAQVRDVYQALATKKCNEFVNLERLETLGDSFLKLAASLFIYLKYPEYNEGKATTLKGKLVSNKNLYYCGLKRDIPSMMLTRDLVPSSWLPPAFGMPDLFLSSLYRHGDRDGQSNNDETIEFNEWSSDKVTLFDMTTSRNEKVGGHLMASTISRIEQEVNNEEAMAGKCMVDVSRLDLSEYLNEQSVSDKQVADAVEALLGVYVQTNGFEGGVQMLHWFGILPDSESFETLLLRPLPNPVIHSALSQDPAAVASVVDQHVAGWRAVEQEIGYTFRNRAYLLQALTHATYALNHVTNSYERLEFIGDAVLDYLITLYIFEHGGDLNPGELTDLRSALVNNETFAGYAARLRLHQHMLHMSPLLLKYISRYVEYMHNEDYSITADMLKLIDDGDTHSAEFIDVPKAVGDLFESVIGAVYLDCGLDLNVVWRVVYKIMYHEIDMFSASVPKSPIRLLYEFNGAHPKFLKTIQKSKEEEGASCKVPLQILHNGVEKIVYGYGSNKKAAKKAAAKIALYLLSSGVNR